MDSGNNNPKQPNKLPALSNTSIQSLSNQVRLLGDVLQESSPLHWYDRAIQAQKENKREEAFYCINKAIFLNPLYAEAYYERAYIRSRTKGWSTFKEGFVFDMDKAEALGISLGVNEFYDRGKYKCYLKDYLGSIADYSSIITLLSSPNAYNVSDYYLKKKAYSGRASNKQAIGDLIGAIEDYSKAIEIDNNYIEALSDRAIAYNKLGMLEEAERDRALAEILNANNK